MNISEHKSSDKNRCTFNLNEIPTSNLKLKLKINDVISVTVIISSGWHGE